MKFAKIVFYIISFIMIDKVYAGCNWSNNWNQFHQCISNNMVTKDELASEVSDIQIRADKVKMCAGGGCPMLQNLTDIVLLNIDSVVAAHDLEDYKVTLTDATLPSMTIKVDAMIGSEYCPSMEDSAVTLNETKATTFHNRVKSEIMTSLLSLRERYSTEISSDRFVPNAQREIVRKLNVTSGSVDFSVNCLGNVATRPVVTEEDEEISLVGVDSIYSKPYIDAMNKKRNFSNDGYFHKELKPKLDKHLVKS